MGAVGKSRARYTKIPRWLPAIGRRLFSGAIIITRTPFTLTIGRWPSRRRGRSTRRAARQAGSGAAHAARALILLAGGAGDHGRC